MFKNFLNEAFYLADEYSRAQSSSVSPRGGGYCSSASTPHSSTGGSGSYGTTSIANGYGPPPIQMSGLSTTSPASSANVFNSTSSKFERQKDD